MDLRHRDQILEGMGLTDQDLLDFVEVRGREVQFMRRVWEEVDSILNAMRFPRPDSTSGER